MTDTSDQLDAARDRLRAQTPAPYLTVEEVAALARCEHKAIRHAVHSGALPAFRTAARILIREADAIAWIESRPARQAAPAQRRRRAKQRRQAPGSVASLRALDRELSG